MLKEKEELMQYIGNINDCTRLNTWFFFFKNRGGIPRALTIIARHYLFDVYNYSGIDPKLQKAAREKTKHLLAAWCGFDYLKDCDEYIDTELIKKDKIENWLPNYIFAHPYKNAQKELMENELASFKKERSLKWYVPEQKDMYQLVNHTFSINSINFYTIIADAINDGPLRDMKLVYDEERFSGDITLSSSEKSRILCIIAAYLLALKGQPPANQTINLNNIDLSNRMNYPSLGRGNHIDTMFRKVSEYITYTDSGYIIEKAFLEKYKFKIE